MNQTEVAVVPTMRLSPISSPTLADTALEALRESILSGRFLPGERLVEAELARELGVSRGPIREGLALLEKDGIVENVPRRGKFVLRFDDAMLDELYSMRTVLETYAADRVMASLTAAKRDLLLASLEDIEQAVQDGDVPRLALRDVAFHESIYDLADHKLLNEVWNKNIVWKLRMLLNITTKTHGPDDPVTNHKAIVEAILRRNARQVRALVTEHIEDGRQRARYGLAQASGSGSVAAPEPDARSRS